MDTQLLIVNENEVFACSSVCTHSHREILPGSSVVPSPSILGATLSSLSVPVNTVSMTKLPSDSGGTLIRHALGIRNVTNSPSGPLVAQPL